MRKVLLLPVLLIILSLTYLSCGSDSNNPTSPTPTQKGSVFVTSNPQGAQIFQGSTNTNKVTPDSITNLDPGNIFITLKLSGFKDTTFAATVQAGVMKSYTIALTSAADLRTFGPVRIFETQGTTAAQPSGLSLSTGTAVGISSTNKGIADLYYSSNGFVIASTFDLSGVNRNTYFAVGNASNLNDHVPAPQFSSSSSSWIRSVSDREPNYVFVYDNDGHYSKIKYQQGGGTPGNPSYVDVTWIYNNTAGNTTF